MIPVVVRHTAAERKAERGIIPYIHQRIFANIYFPVLYILNIVKNAGSIIIQIRTRRSGGIPDCRCKARRNIRRLISDLNVCSLGDRLAGNQISLTIFTDPDLNGIVFVPLVRRPVLHLINLHLDGILVDGAGDDVAIGVLPDLFNLDLGLALLVRDADGAAEDAIVVHLLHGDQAVLLNDVILVAIAVTHAVAALLRACHGQIFKAIAPVTGHVGAVIPSDILSLHELFTHGHTGVINGHDHIAAVIRRTAADGDIL